MTILTNKIDDLYSFIAADYYATGEGRTICLLITRAYPRQDDYEIVPEYIKVGDKYEFHPGILKNGSAARALREFTEVFDSFIARGAIHYTSEQFFKEFGRFLPEVAHKMLTDADQPGNFYWRSELHFNFS